MCVYFGTINMCKWSGCSAGDELLCQPSEDI